MTVQDWGALPAWAVAPLYAREHARWRQALAWDTATSWDTVETARVSWGLPGLVCRDDDGCIRGWAFFLIRDDLVDVGGLVADTEAAAATLVGAIVARAGSPARLGGLIYAGHDSVASAFAVNGVATERYAYLARATMWPPPPADVPPSATAPLLATLAAGRPHHLAAWDDADRDEAAALLDAAYGDDHARLIPQHDFRGWDEYLRQLVMHDGCGVLAREMSQLVRLDGALVALSLVTTIAPSTAHLAQLVVAPAMRRAGLGRALIEDAVAAARRAGHQTLSLLVAERNTAACAVYARAGFTERGVFLSLR